MKRKLAVLLSLLMIAGLCTLTAKGQQEGASSDEPYNLTMAYIGNPQPEMDMVVEEINKLTMSELNMTFELVQVGFGDFMDKFRLMLAGGDQLDVFPVYFTQAPSYVNNGQVVDLNDYIADYGRGIIETLGSDLAYGAQVNGHLYGLPAQKESNNLSGVVMRKDIVEKYNIDVDAIHDLKDLTKVFQKVKAGEPNMVMISGINLIYQSIYYDALSDGLGIIDVKGDTGKVVNLFETEWYYEYTKMIREWYEAGYVLLDAATTTETAANLVKAGNLFCYISPIKPYFLVQEEKVVGRELEIAYFEDTAWIGSSNVNFFNWAIAENSEDPAKAMEFLNFAYTNKDFMNLINWGIEGKHYRFVEGSDTVITYPEGKDASTIGYNLNIGWELPNQFLGYIWEGNPADLWEQYMEFNAEARLSPAFGFIYDPSTLSAELTALANVINQYQYAVETGSVDPDKALPEFNKKLYEAGLQKVIDEKQRQYDAWMASK